VTTWTDACADLLLGSRCVGCERPGRMLCPACRAALPTGAAVAWPSPVPPGLVTPWACGAYDGALKEMIVGHKDRQQLRWCADLADLLALAIGAAVAAVPPEHPVLLVPVPSRPGSARSRGHDPLGRVVRASAVRLRATRQVVVAPLLVSRGGVADQAGLGARDRALNLAGSMRCRGRRLGRVARRVPRAHVVLCDDVVTTGSTAREAQRALEAVGLTPRAVAAVAATRRTHPLPRGRSG
jgi:predicted amidophosphoribosyltransferase